jgi:hypothetical protein
MSNDNLFNPAAASLRDEHAPHRRTPRHAVHMLRENCRQTGTDIGCSCAPRPKTARCCARSGPISAGDARAVRRVYARSAAAFVVDKVMTARQEIE